ncbi:MAG: Exodeoxyribonuclease 7 large subunit [Proteobacteria bacterium]|nr:MAG: Exodeoxyribonuclease 7 large subunit [Pseudomonadota bacterium]
MDLFDFAFDDEQKSSENKVNRNDLTIKGDSFKDERPLSVSELSGVVKTMVEGVGKVVVKGEISNLSTPASGHIYFKIKDERNIINAVIWKSAARSLKVRPEDGMEVILTGKLTVFSARSEYQINVTKLEPAGLGNLMQVFEKRKAEFEKQGLFDEAHKKVINKIPQTIAIVTSQTGDVFYDIMHRIEQRYPCHVLLYPSKVQGEGANLEIVQAIKDLNILNKTKPIDTIIVARGGGSLEDLWTFNEEDVVKAAFESQIPIISAIGHEPDYTLLDYVADLRAPTPTGAAELATYELVNLKYTVNNYRNNILNAITSYIQNLEYRLDRLRFSLNTNAKFIDELNMKFKYLKSQLLDSVKLYYADKQKKLEQNKQLLETLSPKAVLSRGYSFVESEDGDIIASSKTKEQNVVIHFNDGTRKAELKND